MIGDQIIYQSRPFRRNGNLKRFGLPILSDFGEAQIGDRHQGSIQPDLYRAPEVLLGMEWTSKADIWNVGVLMVATRQFSTLQKWLHCSGRLHSNSCNGQVKAQTTGLQKNSVDIPQTSLEDSLASLVGEIKTAFLNFALKTLRWDPDKRPSARELLTDS